VGELGYELYSPRSSRSRVYDVIVSAGRSFGLRLAANHALNSLRMEKAYRHWATTSVEEDTPLEAGLQFAIAWNKPGGSSGLEPLRRQREAGLRRRLVRCPRAPPIACVSQRTDLAKCELVGRISSGMSSAMTIRWLPGSRLLANGGAPVSAEWQSSAVGQYEEVRGGARPARVSLRPFYDLRASA